MAKVKVQRSSWLKLSTFESLEVASIGKTFSYFDLPAYPEIPNNDDDLLHVITTSDRPDRLAYNYYGDPRLWWVIAVRNGWDQPLTSMVPGVEITIPSPRYVRERLVR